MSITQTKSGTFQGYVTDPAGNRYRKTFTDKTMAQSWELETRLNITKGIKPTTNTASGEMTLGDAFDELFLKKWGGSRSRMANLSNAKMVTKHFGSTTGVSRITSRDVEAFKTTLQENHQEPATVNKKLSALSQALKQAKLLDALEHLPTIQRVPEITLRPRFVSEDVVDRLVVRADMMGMPDVSDAIVIACRTGIRQNELVGLHSTSPSWDENFVDLDANELVIVHTKNGNIHHAPMPKRVVPIVKRRIEASTDGKLFSTMTTQNLKYRFGKVCKAEGIKFRWHDLRHCFCSWHVQKGTPIEAVCRLANHGDIKVTMRYAYLCKSNYHDYAQRLD
jgi:integrase